MNHPPHPSHPSPTTHAPSSATGAELRLGTMHADRACVRCGFNLHGQTIVREPHYAMVMVRCPECGQVASLQEYPVLGRWAARWAGLGVIVWLLALLCAATASTHTLYNLLEQTGRDVFTPGGIRIATAYREFFRNQLEQRYPDPAQRAQWAAWWDANPVESYPMVGSDYLADPAYLQVRRSLTLENAADWGHARTIGWMAAMGLALGAGWSVLCPHFRRRGLALLALLLALGVAGWWVWTLARASPAAAYGGQEWGPTLAFKALGAPVVPIGLAIAWLSLLAGMLIGRPLARGLVVLLLPPRLRSPLGFLWTLQGLTVPAPRRPRVDPRATPAGATPETRDTRAAWATNS